VQGAGDEVGKAVGDEDDRDGGQQDAGQAVGEQGALQGDALLQPAGEVKGDAGNGSVADRGEGQVTALDRSSDVG
jgi:hypothetical protein